jgi:SecY interacting protein Syd
LNIQTALDQFVVQYIDAHRQQNQELLIQFDPSWPSACYQLEAQTTPKAGDWVNWLPVRRAEDASLQALEQALELTIHPQLHHFYCGYWSENLQAVAQQGELTLLFAWNDNDFDRFLQNLVGHVLMKRRLNQPETLFFAVTDEEDFILTVNNATGEVMLEQVGLEPTEVLAKDLATFIAGLTPKLD